MGILSGLFKYKLAKKGFEYIKDKASDSKGGGGKRIQKPARKTTR